MAYLKQKIVTVGDEEITLTGLTGLQRLEYLDAVTDMDIPAYPSDPSPDASPSDWAKYNKECMKAQAKMTEYKVRMWSLLAAYGADVEGENFESRQNHILSNMMFDDIKMLHDEVAKLSGIPLVTEENSEPNNTDSEPTDPKA